MTIATERPVSLPSTPENFSAVIGGRLVAPSEREELVRDNPAHELPVSRYPRATAEDVRLAAEAARAAADRRVWSGMSGPSVHAS